MSPRIGAARGRRDRSAVDAWLDARVGVGRLEDRLLLLVAGALAEHAVEAQPDEQGDEGEDDDDGQGGPILLRVADA